MSEFECVCKFVCFCLLFSLPTAQQCTNGMIRLINVEDGFAGSKGGRVEICIDTLWGTITQDGWGIWEARVTCRQLGYPTDCEYC